VQELLGHRDVSTTMIYTYVLNRGPGGVRSPADRLPDLARVGTVPRSLDNVDAAHATARIIAVQSRDVSRKP
jgi:hypothetical protein